jgi:type 1 glutamine amidotransferase
MLGGEFIKHGPQQKAKLQVTSTALPGYDKLGSTLELTEEWYSFKDYADDLHVFLVQETEGMSGDDYQRGPYPATWARRHGKGRVFYTSLGHREDVWNNASFQQILFSGLGWAAGNIEADLKPNIGQVAPHYREIQKPPAAKA